jgi:hypothetical protein
VSRYMGFGSRSERECEVSGYQGCWLGETVTEKTIRSRRFKSIYIVDLGGDASVCTSNYSV